MLFLSYSSCATLACLLKLAFQIIMFFLNKKTMFLIKQTIYLFELTSISTGKKILQYATKIAKFSLTNPFLMLCKNMIQMKGIVSYVHSELCDDRNFRFTGTKHA